MTATAGRLRQRALPPGGMPWVRMPWAAAASLALHAAALGAVLLLLNRPKQPDAPAEQSVEVVWQEQTGVTEGEPSPPAAPAEPEPPPPPPPAAPSPPPPSLAPPPPLAALLPPPVAPDAVTLPPPPPEDRPPPQVAQAPPAPVAPPAVAPPQPEPEAEADPLPMPPPEPPPPQPPPPQPRPRPAPARPAAPSPSPGQAAAPPAGPVSQQPLTTGAAPALGAITPPGLAEGIRNPDPDYPYESKQRGEQGVVTVLLRIAPDGTVEDVAVVSSSGFPALDDSARRAVQRWRFRPAMRDGIPISGNIRTAIHFRLQR